MKRKNTAVLLSVLLMLMAGINSHVTAAPSIGQLQSRAEAEIMQPENGDGTNTAEVMAREGVYVDTADSGEYMKEEEGVLIPTKLSGVIDAARDTKTETNQNGKSIVEDIPSVKEILSVVNEDADRICKEEYQFDLGQMKQLTYMMDLKYITTNHRVTAGEEVKTEEYAVVLDDGMVKAKIYGGEIIRQDNPASIYLIHINEKSEKISILQMEEYDPQTGIYTVTFPGIGPFMVVQER